MRFERVREAGRLRRSRRASARARGRRAPRLRPAAPGRGLARPPRPLARRGRSRRPLLRHAARPRGPRPRTRAGPAGRRHRRRPHRRRGGGDPARPRPPRDLRRSARTGTSPSPSTANEAALVTEHMRGTGIDVRLGVERRGDRSRRGGRVRARSASRRATRSRATSWSPRSASSPTPTSSTARASPSPRAAPSRWTTALRATAARRLGGGRLRQRHLGRRLAPARAALVHRPRPGPRRRALDARRRRRLPSRHLVQLREVLRPRVDDGGLGARAPQLGQHAARSRSRRADAGSSACPGSSSRQRIVCKGDRVVGFNMLGSRWDHEPLLQWIDERRSPRLGARPPARGAVRRGVHAAVPRPCQPAAEPGRSLTMQAGLLEHLPSIPVSEPAGRGVGRFRCCSWPSTSSSTSAATLPAASAIHIDVFETLARGAGLDNKWTLYGILYTLAMVAGGVLLPEAPRQQPLPADPHARGRLRAGRPRLRPARRPEGLREPRVLLLVLLAAQDRVLLPVASSCSSRS